MAPPDPPKPGKASPQGDNKKRDEGPPFQDVPPRLWIAINRTPYEPNRTLPETKVGATVPANETGSDPILDACGATYLTEILDWIAKGLVSDFSDTWTKSDAARPKDFPSSPEEDWARRVAELFTGLAYAGPDIIAGFPKFGKADPPAPAKKRPLYPIAYIYQRIQQKYAKREDFCTAKTTDLAPLVDNTDPAYSLVCACQHVATYVVLSRGFRIETDMLGVGLSAAANAKHPIFTAAKGGKWIGYDDGTHGEKPLDVAYAIRELGMGSGSVYCYDPYRGVSSGLFFVTYEDLVKKDDGSLDTNKDGSPKVSFKASARVWNEGDTGGYIPVVLAKIQAEGSHILAITRIEAKDKAPKPGGGEPAQRAQAFESGGINWVTNRKESCPSLDNPTETVSALAATLATGMFDGDWAKNIYPGNKYVGLGIPGPAPDLAGMTAFLAKARPVGLARLVILRTLPKPVWDRPDASDIVYVSRIIRTWGDGETDNFSPARFMQSLRNTPYYRSLQAYWFLYAPMGKLAEVMWKEGARSRGAHEFIEDVYEYNREYNKGKTVNPYDSQHKTTQLVPQVDFLCTVCITHDANGLAKVLWRNSLGGGGGENGEVPSVLKKHFVVASQHSTTLTAKLKGIDSPWNTEFVHKAIRDAGGKVKTPALLDVAEPQGDKPPL